MPFPEDGLVYDYCLDDGGISKFGADDDEIDDKSTGSEVVLSFLGSRVFDSSIEATIVSLTIASVYV